MKRTSEPGPREPTSPDDEQEVDQIGTRALASQVTAETSALPHSTVDQIGTRASQEKDETSALPLSTVDQIGTRASQEKDETSALPLSTVDQIGTRASQEKDETSALPLSTVDQIGTRASQEKDETSALPLSTVDQIGTKASQEKDETSALPLSTVDQIGTKASQEKDETSALPLSTVDQIGTRASQEKDETSALPLSTVDQIGTKASQEKDETSALPLSTVDQIGTKASQEKDETTALPLSTVDQIGTRASQEKDETSALPLSTVDQIGTRASQEKDETSALPLSTIAGPLRTALPAADSRMLEPTTDPLQSMPSPHSISPSSERSTNEASKKTKSIRCHKAKKSCGAFEKLLPLLNANDFNGAQPDNSTENSQGQVVPPSAETTANGNIQPAKCVVCNEAAPQESRFEVISCDQCFHFFAKNHTMIEPFTHISTGCGNVFMPFFLNKCIKAGMQPPQVPNTSIRARREGVKMASCQVCGIGTEEMRRCGLQCCNRCYNLFVLFSAKLQELRCVHSVDRFGRRCGRCRLIRCLKLGMKSDCKGSSSATDVTDVIQCAVCWQLAPQQPSFGVACCYQCEGFFRLNHNKLRVLECSGHLVSDEPCNKCWLSLCLQAGMQYDGSEPRTVATPEQMPPHETQGLRDWLSKLSLLDILVYTSKGISLIDNSRSMLPMANFFNRLDSLKQDLFTRTLTEMGKEHEVKLLEMIRAPNRKISEADLQTNVLVIPDNIFKLSELAVFNEVRNKARWIALKQGTLAEYIDPILQSEYKRGDVEWWTHEPFEKMYLEHLQKTFQNPRGDSRTEIKKRPRSPVAVSQSKRRKNLTMNCPVDVTVIDQVTIEDEPLHEDRNGNVKHSEVDSVPELPKRDLLVNGSSTEQLELVLPSEKCVIPDRFVSNEDRNLFLRKRDKIRMLVLAANLLEKYQDQCLQTEIDSGTYQEYWFLADGYIDEYFKMLDCRNGGVQNRQNQAPALFPGSSRGLAEEKASRHSTQSPVQVADCGVPHMTEEMLVGSESIGKRPIEGPTEEPSPAPSPVCTDLIIDDDSGEEGEEFEMDSETYYGNSFSGDEEY